MTNTKLAEKLIKDVLSLINVKGYNVVQLKNSNQILYYAENLWTLLPDFNKSSMDTIKMVRAFQGPITIKFADKMRDICGAVEPAKMVFYNRKKGAARRFIDGNFESLIEHIHKEYPTYVFERYIGGEDTISGTVKIYSSFKWIFAMAGSNIMNVVFMKPRSGICLFLCNTFDGSSVGCCVSRDLISVAFINAYNKHATKGEIKIMINRTISFVRRSLEALQVGHI